MTDTAISSASAMPLWRRLYVEARAFVSRLPMSVLLLAMRIAIGFVFFNSGMLKARSFEFAVRLFRDEYHLPLLPPDLAARIAMTFELSMPILLFLGLATRLATVPLIGMSIVIVTLVYPDSWVETLLWCSVLFTLLSRGAGAISLDHLIESRLSGDRPAKGRPA